MKFNNSGGNRLKTGKPFEEADIMCNDK